MSDSLNVLPTICALDCPDACALHIKVENGKVTELTGDPLHPITRGFACVKTSRYPERQEQADRVLTPMKRVGPKGAGQFETITWEHAVSEIAQRLGSVIETHGPQSVLPYHYGGTMGVIQGDAPRAFFRAIGALELDQTICATTGGAAWEANYGPNKYGTDPEEIVHSRYIVLWGINAMRSNSHLGPFMKEARKRGAHILHIDPYKNETSRFADEHWQIRVGTDAALALAIAGEIFRNNWHDVPYLNQHAVGWQEMQVACEEWPLERAAEYCDVPLDALKSMVQNYAIAESSFIRVGYGMTRNEGGGNALRAITLLPAIIGAWKRRGGGAHLSSSGAFQLNRDLVTGLHLKRPEARVVNMNLLGGELDPSSSTIHSMIVFNCNPAAVAPDSAAVRRGLAREDLFTVVLEHFQTDTADYADYLLPATTFLEHSDVYTSYGHYYLQYSDPVVEPRGEAKSNRWIFEQIALKMGLKQECLYWDTRRLVEELLKSNNPWLKGITADRLMKEKSIKLNLPKPFLPYSNGSNFDDQKIRFTPTPKQLTFEEQPSREFPLRLISPPGAVVVNTTMGNVPSIIKMAGGEPHVIVNPNDAKQFGVQHHQRIRVTSEMGSIERRAIVSEDARVGVVIAVGQWWPKLAPDRKSLNDITSQRLTDLGGGSTFGNLVVRIEPI